MSHIVVDEQQAALIARADQSLQVLDPRGKLIAFVRPISHDENEQIAIAKARLESNEPCFTTQEVLDHLRSLDAR
ncbi:MAG TPA: hypothetical protein VGX78_10015 [Pirellulales bacterium]|nr:hypothetical protein [Pirellulales bacterium]